MGEPLIEGLGVGKLLGPQQLEQAEKTLGVVFERGRRQQQDVTPESGDRFDRAVLPVTRVSRAPS